MSHNWSVLLLPLLVACGASGAEGSWEGRCEYDADNGVDLVIDLTTSGKDAGGSAVGAFDTFGYLDILDGSITGSVSGSSLDINIEFEDDTELDIVAERDGDEISGECSDSNGNEGDLELERES